jgi:hypothetical protein
VVAALRLMTEEDGSMDTGDEGVEVGVLRAMGEGVADADWV